jgi:hypothetical protein
MPLRQTTLSLLLALPFLVAPAAEKPDAKPEGPKKKPGLSKEETEEQARLDKYFEGFDKDRNGKLSTAEFRSGFRSGEMGEGAKLFKERDADGDQFLSREEFAKFKSEKFMSKNEKDAAEGRDWKREREKRERERERRRD